MSFTSILIRVKFSNDILLGINRGISYQMVLSLPYKLVVP
jgi:hypothetical protein